MKQIQLAAKTTGGDGQGGIPISPEGGFTGPGPLGSNEGSAIDTFSKLISSTIGLLTIIAVIWFIFILTTGALGIMTAGGDKAAMENARKRISSGLIGLIVVISSVFILDLLGSLLNIDFLDIGQMFSLITN